MVTKLLTHIQHANRVDCCQELLQRERSKYGQLLDRIVTGDETWVYYCDPLSQQEAR